MALEHELEIFRRELPSLIAAGGQGKFALVYGDQLDSGWDSEAEALAAGYDQFGLDPFLVMLITEREEPRFFSRKVSQCH